MKDSGNSICDRVKVDNNFQMVQDLKAIITRIKKMEKVNFTGQMVILILESLDTIVDKEKES